MLNDNQFGFDMIHLSEIIQRMLYLCLTEISKIYFLIIIGGGKIGGPKKGEIRSKKYQAKRTRKEKGMNSTYLIFLSYLIV